MVTDNKNRVIHFLEIRQGRYDEIILSIYLWFRNHPFNFGWRELFAVTIIDFILIYFYMEEGVGAKEAQGMVLIFIFVFFTFIFKLTFLVFHATIYILAYVTQLDGRGK
jgi:hypothetical protein